MVAKRLFLVIAALVLVACESTYYNAMEKVGIHKRDILVDRVEEATESQREAQEQFRDALGEFRSVVSFDGGDLEKLYDRLNASFEDSRAAADDIRDRIDAVESVAEALFEEWEDELSLYSNARLRDDSAAKLRDTKNRYNRLRKSLRRSEKSLAPVLDNLQDNVLYLKHNLNASAISAIKGELATIDRDVTALIATMEAAIAESEGFIAQLR
ncbi:MULTISPECIES: DUF2959 domain-containing protein [Spongiibacter]|uniref:DUF2959 domain-containing protein n=1 Tax=Spongiibacter TaxID=630749 RepID=UPI001960E21B|nr:MULTISPECIES: DUF2959 domain-containing protein [Spongiibacter]MBM7424233.1 hypothetical protein [Spongiibacter marinus]MEE2653565.1 DUF2959 domain-containing protein [Pseudomonadota bacterium]|tara:strand:+ start:3432 stop:4070 length:639 start_codon:yes stop_codon:yes gene_type:complete